VDTNMTFAFVSINWQ